ncbi:MAG: hypothetical protein Fur0037_04780 [Planctomycetota bacterium]
MGRPASDGVPRGILAVTVEEYFHSPFLARVVQPRHWGWFESRVARNVESVLDLLRERGAKATFFVLGIVAERHPEVPCMIASEGHELASLGHVPARHSAETFAEDLRRAEQAIGSAAGVRVLGYRSRRGFEGPLEPFWRMLGEGGYAYDASLRSAPAPFEIEGPSSRPLWEFPPAETSFAGLRLRAGDSGFVRRAPRWLVASALAGWAKGGASGFVFHVASWEFDPEQPRITAASAAKARLQYRNLGRARDRVGAMLSAFRFGSIAEWLSIEPERARLPAPFAVSAAPVSPASIGPRAPEARHPLVTRTRLDIVIPVKDERHALAYLFEALGETIELLSPRYEVGVVFVDDGSKDGSAALIEDWASKRPAVRILRHDRNRGVAAAILTGIRSSSAPFACSIDCDCSYDPREIANMAPLIADCDLVTASPYHPDGQVLNVPRWRLWLSLGLSRIYRRILGSDLHTFTSCFRIARTDALREIEVGNGGFLGVAEMLIRLVRRGCRVREHPALLESRLLGFSKMKTARAILGHLGLIARILSGRLDRPPRRSWPRGPDPASRSPRGSGTTAP